MIECLHAVPQSDKRPTLVLIHLVEPPGHWHVRSPLSKAIAPWISRLVNITCSIEHIQIHLRYTISVNSPICEIIQISSIRNFMGHFRISYPNFSLTTSFVLLAALVLISWQCRVSSSLRDLAMKLTQGVNIYKSLKNLLTLQYHKINITMVSRLKHVT